MVVAAYFTNWSIYARGYEPAKLPIEKLTHVIYAFAKTDPNTGEVSFSDPWADVEKPMGNHGAHGCVGELKRLKSGRNPQLKILLSVGGWANSPDLTSAFTDPAKRFKFSQSSAKLVHQYGLDGLDIDWEYADTHEHVQQLSDVMKLCRKSLGFKYQLTQAVPARPELIGLLGSSQLLQIVDIWFMMCYDFSGSWSSMTGHQANLFGSSGSLSVEMVVHNYLRIGVPAAKLVIGMPLYGRSFAQVSKKGTGASFHSVMPGRFEEGCHELYDLPLLGSDESLDQDACAAYCQGRNFFVTYDNAESAAIKGSYAKKMGLAGGMFWEASGDRSGTGSVINAFYSRFVFA